MIAAEGEQKASRALRLDQISEDIFGLKIKKTMWSKNKGKSSSVKNKNYDWVKNPAFIPREASEMIAESPNALQLRYLQVWS